MMAYTIALRRALIPALALALSGCGYLFGDQGVFRDASEDYKRAPDMPVIEVPEGKSTDALQEIYPVPPVSGGVVSSAEFEVPRPTPLVGGGEDEMVRIQRLGDESWALVAEAPGQVWPQVRSFLTSAGIGLARVDARAGVLETGWLKLESAPMNSRFRMRIEQGVQRGTSELHVLQQSQVGDVNVWPERSDDLEQESEMLRTLAQFIANSAEAAPVSMVAEQGISAGGRITLQEGSGGEPYLQLQLPFDRAWASLGRSLEKSTFEITDRDRSQGVYYTVFLGPQAGEEDGWFDWLWDSQEDHPQAGQRFVVSMEDGGDAGVKIYLRAQDQNAELALRDQQALLSLIKGNIN
jgi:outer membrane protein assembly factor BamC